MNLTLTYLVILQNCSWPNFGIIVKNSPIGGLHLYNLLFKIDMGIFLLDTY